jgi:hypothetical protein
MEIKNPGGHIDQMIRQTRAHHVSLSAQADQKANMILTIASLIIPLSISFLYDPRTHLAAAIMIVFCVLTVLLSAYAAMPKLNPSTQEASRTDRTAFSFNLLFFGSFMDLDYETYKASMETMMNDHNDVYETQIKEIYALGNYLKTKKYRYVRLSYMTFITGVMVSSVVCVYTSYAQ